MVTDSLCALTLECFGYATKVFEFISDAHTAKNILIVGAKNMKAASPNPVTLETLKAAKAYFGIENFHLETMLGL
jgi:hypothetical protein